ncbi:MAG TPA: ankyrin repeat domain-containing protein [Chthoniobacterales bacterium]
MIKRRIALCWLLGILFVSGCSKSKDDAVQGLQHLNLKFTADDYVRSADAGDVKALGLFLEAGINPNVASGDGRNALIAAAEKGRTEALKFLLEHGADPKAAGRQGQTALMAAAENDHPDIVALLLEHHADPVAQDHNGWSALLRAVYRNHADCVPLLADRDRPEVNRGLLVAAFLGFKETTKALLGFGADVNTRSEDKRTPLMLAASKGHKDLAKMLLDAGADPSLTDQSGNNAEALATAKGFAEVASLLRDAPPLASDRQPKAPASPADVAQAPSPPGKREAAASAKPVSGEISDQEILSEPMPPELAGAPALTPGNGGTGPAAGPSAGRTSLRGAVAVSEIHEKFLPVTLADVQGKRAKLQPENGSEYTVGVGDQLRGLDSRVVDVEARNISDKDGNPVDASRVKLRQAKTGETLSLIKGIPAREKGSSVTLRFRPGDETAQVTLDQEFKIPSDPGHSYKVIDIRPRQVIVRRVEDGQVWTLEKPSI